MEHPRTILVVDDDPTVLQAVENYLDDHEYQVVKASLWTEAITELENSTPDAVLLDLHLPTVQGEVLLDFIRQTYPALPVIIISSNISSSEMMRLSSLGASGFIRKPFQTDDLLLVLEQVLVDLSAISSGVSKIQEDARSNPFTGSVLEPRTETSPPQALPQQTPSDPLPSDIVPGSGVLDLAKRFYPVTTPTPTTKDTRLKRIRKKKKRHKPAGSALKRLRNFALILVFFFMIGALIYTLQQGLNIGFLGGMTFNKSLSSPTQQTP